MNRAKKKVKRKDVTKLSDDASSQRSPVESKIVTLLPNKLKQRRVIYGSVKPDLIDHYKVLRTQLMQKLKEKGQKTILITSAAIGEGKSLTALNLAISFAEVIDGYILLVEADLRNPSLQKMLGLNESFKGLVDYILDDVPIEEMLINPAIKKLRFLPAGRTVPNSGELVGSEKMRHLVQELKERYDDRYIIFDTPSLLDYPDTQAFAEFVDAALLVVEAESTPLEKVMEAQEKLQDRNLIGYVLNKARMRGSR